MTRRKHDLDSWHVAVLSLVVALLPMSGPVLAQLAAQTELSGQVDLLRLVDLSVQRLGLKVEYDANALKAAVVTLRLDEPISDEQLWELTNQLLAARGFTSVQPGGEAGVGGSDVFSIVKLSEASGLARVERELPLATQAGYATILLPVERRPLKEVSEAVKVLLSKPGGAIQDLVGQNALLISDLRPRLQQIIEVVQTLDAPGEASTVETIEARNLSAANLAVLVTAAVTSGNTIAARPMQGKLTATPDNTALVLIASQNEMPRWKELIAQFDRPANLETHTYSVSAFSLEQVSKLVEQTVRDGGPRGSGERWRIVQDPLGGLLIITATPSEHEQIQSLIARLNSVPADVRRPVRAFPIRNRSVSEIVDVLTKLLEAGALEGVEFTASSSTGNANGPAAIDQSLLQRSERTAPGALSSPSSVTPPTAPTTAPAPPSVTTHVPTGSKASDRSQPTGTRQPSLTLTADEGTNTLIAVGDPRKLTQLEELLRTLDVRQPQVMVEVLVVSLSEGDTLDLGVELQKIEVSGDTVITLSSLFGLGPAAGGAPTGRGFTGLILNPGDFRVLIRALQTLNNGRSLNMPKVLVNNNQQANLDAVVQQPFVSTNASDTVATTSFGGFENAGTTITVKPQIAKGDHMVLEYAVSLSAFVGESSDPGIPPPRQQNTLQSVVTVPDGYTVVVGGIEVTTRADGVSQVPLLGSLPLVGELFKSRSLSSSRNRFYVFIRPTVLRSESFEDLKYLSDIDTRAADVDDGFPEVEPRIIR